MQARTVTVLILQHVREQQGFLSFLSAKLHGLRFASQITCMQMEVRAELNPLDLTCLEVSSC